MLNLYNYYDKPHELIQGKLIYDPKEVIDFIEHMTKRFHEQDEFNNKYIFTNRSKDDIVFTVRITAKPKIGSLVDWVDIQLKQEPNGIKLYFTHKNENIMWPIDAFEANTNTIDILGIAHMIYKIIIDYLE
jgi:hypothetical protein